MPKLIALCALSVLLAMVGPSIAQTVASPNVRPPADIGSPASAPADATDGATLVESGAEFQRPAVPTEVLAEIAAWLAKNFDLPLPRDLPNVVFARQERIAEIRYRGLINGKLPPPAAPGRPGRYGDEVVAVYVHPTQTIYLLDGWRGDSPRDLSVLVHEMVHHLQHHARIRYPCSEAREKLAYQAQERWLARYGRTLEEELGIDRMTLLIHTNCAF